MRSEWTRIGRVAPSSNLIQTGESSQMWCRHSFPPEELRFSTDDERAA